jgi:hypothetical protein
VAVAMEDAAREGHALLHCPVRGRNALLNVGAKSLVIGLLRLANDIVHVAIPRV